MSHHTGHNLPTEDSKPASGDLEAQEGGGSTPGAIELQRLIQKYASDLPPTKDFEKIVDWYENHQWVKGSKLYNEARTLLAGALNEHIDTTVRTRLLSLPSMADEPEEERPYSIQYRDSELTDLAQFARSSGRNELRASLRAEIKGEKQ